MRRQQILRAVLLRLSIVFTTFTIGCCVSALWATKPSIKIDQPVVAVPIKPAQPATVQTNAALPERTSQPPSPFDPTGDYHPTRRPTVESEKFLQFVLEVRRRKQKLVAWGHLSSNASEFYEFRFVSVTEKHLKFRTRKVKGVYYKFDGRYLGQGNFSDQYGGYAGSVMLEGTLQKFVNGQKVFEINTPFVHYPGC